MNFTKTLIALTAVSVLSAPVIAEEDESPWYFRILVGLNYFF